MLGFLGPPVEVTEWNVSWVRTIQAPPLNEVSLFTDWYEGIRSISKYPLRPWLCFLVDLL